MQAVTIVLYGATGYTGRLVGDELPGAASITCSAGAIPDKLAGLRAGRATPGRIARRRERPARPARGRRRGDQLRRARSRSPATPLVRAAIATGTHYVDSTGEQTFIRMVFDRHGEAAERAGVALLPALGFDYAPATASRAWRRRGSSRSTSWCWPTPWRASA